jgi:hypothetical protein
MIPENLIFLSCQPDHIYFQWQVEVQIVNFREFDISKNMQIVVWYKKGSKELSKWMQLQRKYPEVRIFLYEDSGVNLDLYIPQLRPHTLKKHFERYAEELSGKVLFYHDSDIIFNYLPDFSELVEGKVCWQSDCSHYLDWYYLRRKENEGNIPDHEAIDLLAKIGGISRETIKSYAGKTGGAQTILKGIDADFWRDVEQQVLRIRHEFYWGESQRPNLGSVNHRYFKSEKDGFQSWCADMWALNFALWNRGIPTDVTNELDFSWATDSAETFLQKPIFHNAGATKDKPGLFYKSDWRFHSPIGKELTASPTKASYYYIQAIQNVK